MYVKVWNFEIFGLSFFNVLFLKILKYLKKNRFFTKVILPLQDLISTFHLFSFICMSILKREISLNDDNIKDPQIFGIFLLKVTQFHLSILHNLI